MTEQQYDILCFCVLAFAIIFFKVVGGRKYGNR